MNSPNHDQISAHVFVDESRPKNGPYYVAASKIPAAKVSAARKLMRQLPGPKQVTVHFRKERDSRKRQILNTVAETGAQTRIYQADDRDDVKARYKCLTALVRDLYDGRLIIESRQSQDHRDKRWVNETKHSTGAVFTFDHLPAHSEPLLWIPDAVAWSYGASGKWRPILTELDLLDKVVNV